MKDKLIRTLSSRYFWLNLATSIFIVWTVQIAIYFGCKNGLISHHLANKLAIVPHKNLDLGGGCPWDIQITWRIPVMFEFLLN